MTQDRLRDCFSQWSRQRAPISAPERKVVNSLSILVVARQQFIASFAGQHNFDMTARELGNKIERHTRRMRNGFVFLINEGRERVKEFLRSDNQFVMIGSKRLRDHPRVFKLVSFALVERD